MTAFHGPIGRRNVVWGWVTMLLGATLGTVLMAWSFDGPFPAPPGFEDYGSLARRLMRLAHVAWFMLPLINIVLGRDVDATALPDGLKQLASWGALASILGIPVGLIVDSLVQYHAGLVLSSLGGTGLFVGIALVAWGKLRLPAE